MPRHDVSIVGTPLHAGMTELTEDFIAKAIKHHSDVTVKGHKSSLSLKIDFQVDDRGDLWTATVTPSESLAGRKGVTTSFYGFLDPKTDLPKLEVHSRTQMRLFADPEPSQGEPQK